MSQIELLHMSKTYDGTNRVIEDISLEVKKGEFIILVGPSGCGKSTLLRMIAGLETITGGILKIDGEVANSMRPKDRRISMVFQNYALYPHMTVRDNILFGLDVRKVPSKEQESRLSEAAEMTGLSDYLSRKPGQLSGGQRQRVALARSICSHAPICLMDEPLSNLDAKLRGQMRMEIRRIQKQLGLTVIYVTHDQVEAMTMGDRIMVLSEGRIQQIGTPLELYNSPANRFVAGFIGSPQMNMVDAQVRGDTITLNGRAVLKLGGRARAGMPEGTNFDIGIRAEHLNYTARKTEFSTEVKVLSTELMGNETQVIFEMGDRVFTAKWPGQWEIGIGSNILVEFNPEYYHFFDRENGSLLRAPLFAAKRAFSARAV